MEQRAAKHRWSNVTQSLKEVTPNLENTENLKIKEQTLEKRKV